MRLSKQLIKIYRINITFWELRNAKVAESKINFIVNKHRKAVKNFDDIGKPLPNMSYDNLNFLLYTFSTEEKESHWKRFLPLNLTIGEDFIIQKPSFVLFVHNEEKIFAIIGGKGMFAIKRYLDSGFGFDILSRIADPKSDIIHSIKTRGITGNIAGSSEFYRNDQKLIDTISFGRIHKEILFQFNNDLLAELFEIDIEKKNQRILGLAGSSFQIRTPITFPNISRIIHKILEVLSWEETASISMFVPVIDYNLVEKLIEPRLFEILKERIDGQTKRDDAQFYDYDFCHPSKMELFYECDTYKVFAKNAKTPFFETSDRQEIYPSVLEYVKENFDTSLLGDLMSFLGGVKVRGYKDGEQETIAPFMTHITCEIVFNEQPLFKIDSKWYKVRGSFIADLNRECLTMINSNYLQEDILNEVWYNPKEIDEDEYNKKYLSNNNFLVLDKVLADQIELCDLLYFDNEKLFLIHVKKGFNAKIRDLINQIKISSRRLWSDLNSGEYSFIRTIFEEYVKSDNFKNSEIDTFEKFKNLFAKQKQVVLAFTTNNRDGRKVRKDISFYKSNIAKFSIIESIRDMNNNSYPLKIFEIDNGY